MCEKLPRGEHDATLLALIDRVRSVAIVVSAAVTHLDKCDFVAIDHHEIDLTCSRSKIARNRAKAAANQEALGSALGALAERGRVRSITAPR